MITAKPCYLLACLHPVFFIQRCPYLVQETLQWTREAFAKLVGEVREWVELGVTNLFIHRTHSTCRMIKIA
jgi:hypothetical protein